MSKLDLRVPFPELGEGRFLLFTLRDVAELEDDYGQGEVFGVLEDHLRKSSAQHTIRALEVALKEERDGKVVRCFDPDAFDLPTSAAFRPIMNALALQHFGQTYDVLLADLEKRSKEALEQMAGEDRDSEDPSEAPEALNDS